MMMFWLIFAVQLLFLGLLPAILLAMQERARRRRRRVDRVELVLLQPQPGASPQRVGEYIDALARFVRGIDP